jgi:hypothetical protein
MSTQTTAKQATQTQTTNLYLLEDLDDAGAARELAQSDLAALQAVAHWIKTVVTKPHKDLGRPGPVCPFVPVSLERHALWLAPERSAGKSAREIADLVGHYKSLFLRTEPTGGDDAKYKAILLVFTDLEPARAKEVFEGILQHLGVPSYAGDGLVMGGFYEGNEGTAIYNTHFRPFTAPVPLLLMRGAVISDWKFFLDNDEWFNLWARHHGESAIHALAAELRRMPWRATPDPTQLGRREP